MKRATCSGSACGSEGSPFSVRLTSPTSTAPLISLAEAGDLAAIREIADRLEGKPRLCGAVRWHRNARRNEMLAA
jgi:hypothetical protein